MQNAAVLQEQLSILFPEHSRLEFQADKILDCQILQNPVNQVKLVKN
jgi:hypothetical protein